MFCFPKIKHYSSSDAIRGTKQPFKAKILRPALVDTRRIFFLPFFFFVGACLSLKEATFGVRVCVYVCVLVCERLWRKKLDRHSHHGTARNSLTNRHHFCHNLPPGSCTNSQLHFKVTYPPCFLSFFSLLLSASCMRHVYDDQAIFTTCR